MTCADIDHEIRKTVQGKVRGPYCVDGAEPIGRILSFEVEEVG